MAEEVKSYEIDCSILVNDNLLRTSELEEFYRAFMKVEGRKNNLDGKVSLTSTSSKLVVEPMSYIPKKYIIYLVKKFLHMKGIKNWVKLASTGPTSMELRYFNVEQNEDE
ncbi:60S ribosomal protein L22 [Astathelohania contejeani]|uniref:Large ribosomal subunit protein eL22 n=1 Tax=Astathelohania contejeani TaxID=164912 RepID=A0ABQ7HWP6_9MICR|nr:60S ribosomal protein L22 [Thelohania contejeani]